MNLKEMENKMVFRKDNEYGTFYSLGLSKKMEDGSYQNGYIDARFRKGVELDNMTIINVKDSWITFYLKNENGYNITKHYVFINEFEIVENQAESFDGTQLTIDTDDLPF